MSFGVCDAVMDSPSGKAGSCFGFPETKVKRSVDGACKHRAGPQDPQRMAAGLETEARIRSRSIRAEQFCL